MQFFVAMFVYGTLSILWPARETILKCVVYDMQDISGPEETPSVSMDEKEEKSDDLNV